MQNNKQFKPQGLTVSTQLSPGAFCYYMAKGMSKATISPLNHKMNDERLIFAASSVAIVLFGYANSLSMKWAYYNFENHQKILDNNVSLC